MARCETCVVRCRTAFEGGYLVSTQDLNPLVCSMPPSNFVADLPHPSRPFHPLKLNLSDEPARSIRMLAAHFALGFVAHPPAGRRAPARSCSRASVTLGPFGAADRWYREHSLRIRWQVARCRRQTSPPQPYPHLASPHRVPPPHLTACRLTPPRSSQLTAFRLASDPMAGGATWRSLRS